MFGAPIPANPNCNLEVWIWSACKLLHRQPVLPGNPQTDEQNLRMLGAQVWGTGTLPCGGSIRSSVKGITNRIQSSRLVQQSCWLCFCNAAPRPFSSLLALCWCQNGVFPCMRVCTCYGLPSRLIEVLPNRSTSIQAAARSQGLSWVLVFHSGFAAFQHQRHSTECDHPH